MESESGHTPSYMELSNIKYMLHLPENHDNIVLRSRLLKGMIDGDMAPYYATVCSDLGWEVDQALMAQMNATNKQKLKEFDEATEYVSDDDLEPKIWYDKLIYLCSIGDKDAAYTLATAKYEDKSLSVNRRLDVVFTLYRIAYFHGCDLGGMKSALNKASAMIEGRGGGGGDWSARNKLKVYEAICCLGCREYEKASRLFMDSVQTFESYELVTFGNFVRYAVLAAMIFQPRPVLYENLTKQGDMPQALRADFPELQEYFSSLYECRYAMFFQSLAKMEKFMINDPLLHPHYRQYVREMRIRAYSQMLEAYRSLSLKRMAEAFGVTESFIEKEIARFVAVGRLQCKIDLVAGTVVTCYHTKDGMADEKHSTTAAAHDRGVLYQATIKRGDNLLNRLKKLTKIMDF